MILKEYRNRHFMYVYWLHLNIWHFPCCHVCKNIYSDLCQKQVFRARRSHYNSEILWDVRTRPYPWYQLLAHKSPICWWHCYSLKCNIIYMLYSSWYKTHSPGLYSLSGKTSYRQISRSLEAARFNIILIVSLWNSTGISTALLSNSERLKKHKAESRGFENSWNHAIRRLLWPQWASSR